MPDVLTDPASLAGDDLVQWYRRSPADIEQARQAVFAQRYNDFFNRPVTPEPDPGFDQSLPPSAANSDPGSSQTIDLPTDDPDPDPGLGLVQIGETRWRTVPMFSVGDTQVLSPQSTTSDDSLPDLNEGQALGASGRQLASMGGFCAACHSGALPPPPPVLTKPPYATNWSPTPNLTPRKPAKPHPPQCSMQNMQDSRICSREPGDAWKHVCFRSASERLAHCIATDGEIRWPPLETHDRF